MLKAERVQRWLDGCVASYHRTRLRTALSDTPYFRPTADQFVSASSRMSCSYRTE